MEGQVQGHIEFMATGALDLSRKHMHEDLFKKCRSSTSEIEEYIVPKHLFHLISFYRAKSYHYI